jgi:Fe-S-cluster containining protein
LDEPKEPSDYDFLRWFLMHERATIFVDEGTWCLLMHTECKHLQPDLRCAIYATRPQVCRDYSTESCEYDEDLVYDRYFETPEQFEEYLEVVLPPAPGQSIRSPRPPLFPILG